MKILLSTIFVCGLASHSLSAQGGGDTVVNPPALELGTLLISGDLGAGQKKSIDFVAKCEPDSEFQWKQFSCQEFRGGYEINSPITLPVGYYQVLYSNSIMHGIQVTANHQTRIRLSKISVAAQSGTTFRAFEDLTDTSEQDKCGYSYWGSEKSRKIRDLYCKKSPTDSRCLAFGDKPQALKSQIWDTDKDGKLLLYYQFLDGSPQWRDWGIPWVNEDSKTGNFVSVFPGVYGVQFVNQFGIFNTTYGVVAN